jgi:hypothetical protein
MSKSILSTSGLKTVSEPWSLLSGFKSQLPNTCQLWPWFTLVSPWNNSLRLLTWVTTIWDECKRDLFSHSPRSRCQGATPPLPFQVWWLREHWLSLVGGYLCHCNFCLCCHEASSSPSPCVQILFLLQTLKSLHLGSTLICGFLSP